MKLLEIVKLRSGNLNQQELIAALNNIVFDAQKNIDQDSIAFYSNEGIFNEFMFCLLWDQSEVNSRESTLGLEIKKAIENLGLISHSSWIEPKIRKTSK